MLDELLKHCPELVYSMVELMNMSPFDTTCKKDTKPKQEEPIQLDMGVIDDTKSEIVDVDFKEV